MEKLSILNKMPHDWLKQQVDPNISLMGMPYAGLMSSLATSQDDIVVCDTGTNFTGQILCVFIIFQLLIIIHYVLYACL